MQQQHEATAVPNPTFVNYHYQIPKVLQVDEQIWLPTMPEEKVFEDIDTYDS